MKTETEEKAPVALTNGSTQAEGPVDDVLRAIAPEARRLIKNNKNYIWLILLLLCIAVLIVDILVIDPIVTGAVKTATDAGRAGGQAAGWAVGSVEGAVQGVPAGIREGTEEGLSARDTFVAIANSIEEDVTGLGRLEVLAANVKLTTYHEEGEKYKALFLARGSAVFTVDLGQAQVTYNEQKNRITIVLPRPEVELRIDPTETEKLAEWERKYLNGTDSEGLRAYLNSFKSFSSKSETEIENYSALLDLASSSAINQITELANAVRGDPDIIVTVSMMSN